MGLKTDEKYIENFYFRAKNDEQVITISVLVKSLSF